MNRKPPPPKLQYSAKNSAWRDVLNRSFKVLGLAAWLVVLLLGLLEIKRHYKFDVIPNYDSSVDDLYGATRGTVIDWFK